MAALGAAFWYVRQREHRFNAEIEKEETLFPKEAYTMEVAVAIDRQSVGSDPTEDQAVCRANY